MMKDIHDEDYTGVKDGEVVRVHYGEGRYIERQYYAPVEPVLADVQAERIQLIKQEAAERITALNWQIQRADDRDLLGAGGGRVLRKAVAQQREDIRTANNDAEAAVMLLTTVEDVQAFTW